MKVAARTGALCVAALLVACSTSGSDRPDARIPFPDGAALPPDAPPVEPPDAAPPPPPDAPPPDALELPPRYTTDRTLSPITGAVARNLRAIAMKNGDLLQDDVFEKVGDSITVAVQFVACFAGTGVDLGGRTGLQGTLDTFKAKKAAGATSYERVSLAAKVGWSADGVLAGTPVTLLEQETAAVKPRYALVMFGTNDAASRTIYTYAASLWNIIDQLAQEGVIPIMTSVPSNLQSTTVDALIPRFNLVSRGLAQARLFPYMDLWKELQPLTNKGLGGDDLHPSVFSGGACKLTADGLKFGYNVRNLLTLETLARAQAAVQGDVNPDAEPPVAAVSGLGSYDQPFLVSALPFTDMHDTTQSTNKMIGKYTGCNAAQDESGAEYVYKIILSSPAMVRATVLVRGNTDVDVHLMKGLTAADCLARNDKEVAAMLQPGTYYFILDTFVPADGTPRAGEYLFLVTAD